MILLQPMNIHLICFILHYFLFILGSQISGRRQNENSHMIQIMSLENSIWRGEVWLKIYFKIKFGKTYLHGPRKGVPSTFNPKIEYFSTRVTYESDCNKVKLQLASNTVIDCNGFKALVTMDPYNSLESDIHTDIVVSGGSFVLVINSRC